jgi:branched-chain amino acid transport system permease protein
VPRFAATALTLLVDGVAFGMVLFLISAGLTVTLGVMRVVNLAHCAFAMVGGYFAIALATRWGLPVLAAIPLAAALTMLLGALLERTVYRWVYQTSELGQILMTIGLTFVMVAAVNALFGSTMHALPLPSLLSGVWEVGPVALSVYRAFIVMASVAIAIALWAMLEYTDFGARLRASVDNPRMARCVGIPVPRVFAITFAIGCGLAALGGALGSQLLPIEPWYAFKYLVLVLMVVAVGGLGSLKGSFFAALALGLIDTFGRYLVPAAGAFVIYLAVGAILLWRPQGLFARN